jgi:hypothetical protein
MLQGTLLGEDIAVIKLADNHDSSIEKSIIGITGSPQHNSYFFLALPQQ